jgi:Small metal-binding protein
VLVAILLTFTILAQWPVSAWALSNDIQGHVKAMQKDAEDMVAHGGMGDAKAIVHHCGEVTKHAEAILGMLTPSDPHSTEAAAHLREAIGYCQKVAKFGSKVDPGVSLNPATKARSAVNAAVKQLSLTTGGVTRQ